MQVVLYSFNTEKLMSKEFIKLTKHSKIYSMADIIPKAVGLFMIPVYTRFLIPTDYGIIAMLMSFAAFMPVIVLIGLDSAFMRFYFEGKSKQEKNTIYNTALIAVTVSTTLVTLLLLNFTSQISLVLFASPQHAFYIKLMFITLLFQVLNVIPIQFFVAQKNQFFIHLYQ